MAKDSYWFKHDSTAGRAVTMRKMSHIHGHWGKGVYWDVIEMLRDQDGYKFECDESSLQLLADLIGCKDDAKFLTWYRDCTNMELFIEVDGYFHSEVLSKNMSVWETKKNNGSKGGRPHKNRNETETITETITESKADGNHKIREENIIEDKSTDIPTLKAFSDYAISKDDTVSLKAIEFKYLSWTENGWKDGNDRKIKNWKSKLLNTLQYLEKDVSKYKSPEHTPLVDPFGEKKKS